jgi:rhamnosyltransferase
MKRPRASIALVTRNGGQRLVAVLDAIDAQHGRDDVEIVAVDSGSTDGTRERLATRVDRLVDIDPRDFNHGATRNRAIAETRAPLVILLVQDAVPRGLDWLDELLAPLEGDSRLAGSCARQVPRPDASAVVRHHLDRWAAARPEPRTTFADAATLEALPPIERLALCAFDNVCAAIRRAVWEQHPFEATPIAEDIAWARDVLLAGHGLAYAPSAVVEHSHDRSAWYELKRTWVLHQQLHRLFGLRTIPTPLHLARAVAGTAALHHRLVSEAGGGLADHGRAATLAVAWPLGQYAGGVTAAHGRIAWRPRGV